MDSVCALDACALRIDIIDPAAIDRLPADVAIGIELAVKCLAFGEGFHVRLDLRRCGVFVLVLCPTMAKQIVKDNVIVSDLDPSPPAALGIDVAENRVALLAFPNRSQGHVLGLAFGLQAAGACPNVFHGSSRPV